MAIRKRPGEKKDEFVSRCIIIETQSGKTAEQSAAICYSMWDEKQLKAVKNIRRKNRKFKQELENFEKIRVYVDSTNADRVMWNSETLELVIRFNDGSTYTYFDVSEKIFEDIIDGKARTKTSGPWGPAGKSPSVGAAIHKYLIKKGIAYNTGGTFR